MENVWRKERKKDLSFQTKPFLFFCCALLFRVYWSWQWTQTQQTGSACFGRTHTYNYVQQYTRINRELRTHNHRFSHTCTHSDVFMYIHSHTHRQKIGWNHLFHWALLWSVRIWTFSTHKGLTLLCCLGLIKYIEVCSGISPLPHVSSCFPAAFLNFCANVSPQLLFFMCCLTNYSSRYS